MKYATLSKLADSEYLRKLEFIEQAVQQLIKDFELIGLTISFSRKPAAAYDEFYMQLLPVITQMASINYPKLLQLLYRIDIDEQLIATAVEKEQLPLENVLTCIIIYRELQKVVLRDYFKNGGKV